MLIGESFGSFLIGIFGLAHRLKKTLIRLKKKIKFSRAGTRNAQQRHSLRTRIEASPFSLSVSRSRFILFAEK